MKKLTAQELLDSAALTKKTVSLKNGKRAVILCYVLRTDEYVGYICSNSEKEKVKATTWTRAGVNTENPDYNIKVISSTNELAEYALQNNIGMTIQTPYGRSTVNVIGKTKDSRYITVYQSNSGLIAEYVSDDNYSLDKVDLVL